MGQVTVIQPEGLTLRRIAKAPITLTHLRRLLGGREIILIWPTEHVRIDGEPTQFWVRASGGQPNPTASALCRVDEWRRPRPIEGPLVILTGDARWGRV